MYSGFGGGYGQILVIAVTEDEYGLEAPCLGPEICLHRVSSFRRVLEGGDTHGIFGGASPQGGPREAETHLWLRGFSASLGERTDTAALFTRTHAPRRGVLKRLLNAVVGAAPAPVQKIRLLASEAGEGRTRLTVPGGRQGEGPDEGAPRFDSSRKAVLLGCGDLEVNAATSAKARTRPDFSRLYNVRLPRSKRADGSPALASAPFAAPFSVAPQEPI